MFKASFLGRLLIALGSLGAPIIYLGNNQLNHGGQDLIREVEAFSTDLGINWTKESTLDLTNLEQRGNSRKIGKKFLLVGVNESNKKVNFAGLISIVVAKQGPWYKCNEQIKAQNISFEDSVDGWESIKQATKDTGLWFPQQKQLSLSGRIAFGNCKDEFYKEVSEVEIVEELKGKQKTRTGLQKLSILGGMHIARITNIKHNQQPISTSGILNNNVTNNGNGKTLWAGLQEDGRVRRTMAGGDRDPGQGFVVVHNWINKEVIERSESHIEKETSNSKNVEKIKLKEEGNGWYLWDPSYTHIKNGKYETKDGQILPWKIDTNLPFSFNLTK